MALGPATIFNKNNPTTSDPPQAGHTNTPNKPRLTPFVGATLVVALLRRAHIFIPGGEGPPTVIPSPARNPKS